MPSLIVFHVFSESILVIVDIFEDSACTLGNAVEGIFGDINGHTRLTVNESVKTSQQSTAACKSDTVVDNICGKLRRSFLKS